MSSRLRVIAGPNGAGKSSIFEIVKNYKDKDTGKVISTGPFVNSDQIEKTFREIGFIKFLDFGISSFEPSLVDEYLKVSTLRPPYDPNIIKTLVTVENGGLRIKNHHHTLEWSFLILFARNS